MIQSDSKDNMVIFNYNNILQQYYCLLYFWANTVNAALVSIKDFFRKTSKKSYQPQTFEV